MAGEGKSTILIATISAISAIVVALITSYGTIFVSAGQIDDARKTSETVKKDLKDISNLQLIKNLPVGTVVPSMLKPSLFAEAVGDVDRDTPEWVLADGDKIESTSHYSQKSGETRVPDLRGMFLRGMNEGREDGDPQANRTAGDYQKDAFAEHEHKCPVGYFGQEFTPKSGRKFWTGIKVTEKCKDKKDSLRYVNRRAWTDSLGTEDETQRPVSSVYSDETRPKNVAVYFYIKIN